MNFEVTKNGTATVFKLKEQSLDSTIAPELKGEFLLITRTKASQLVIDLSDVRSCDSSGLSALLIAERQMRNHGGVVKLVGVRKTVLSLLKIAQLDRVFQIFPTVSEALKV
ncbi:MAG: STAS domain-containing protein [Bacteroidota bacterium]